LSIWSIWFIWFILTIWDTLIFFVVFNFFFQGFVVCVFFIDSESSIPWVISDALIMKVGWRFHD
jgi:hypothetical protein